MAEDDKTSDNIESQRSGSGRYGSYTSQDPALQDAGGDIDMRSFFMMLWRRRVPLVAVVVIGISVAAVLLHFIQPQYTARAIVLIESQSGGEASMPANMRGLMNSVRLDTSLVLNELEIIRSRMMARKVVERLNLMTDPEFNPRFRTADGSGAGGQSGNFRQLSVYKSELDNLPPDVVDEKMEDVVSRFLDRLSVRSVPGSYAIQVEITSGDPAKAARIANAVVDLYVEQRLEQKFQATKKVTDWLDRRLQELRIQVREAEAAVEQYKRQHNLVTGARTVVSAEQLSQLNSQLVQAKAQKAEAEARLSEVRELTRNPGKIETSYEIINSPLIQNLRVQEVNLVSRLSELSSRYGERHPEIVKTRSELGQLRDSLQTEMMKIANSVQNEVRLASARVNALENGLHEIEGKRQEDNQAMIRLREIEREAEASRLILDTFLQTYKRNNEQEELQEPEARVISYAAIPNRPSYPNVMLVLSMAAALSLFLGLALVLLLEKLDNAFRSANQLESSMGFPCFALIPTVENMSQSELGRYILSKPSSTLAESVRTLRMVINLRKRKSAAKPKVVTITSSFPHEGKTTLSVWMGRLAAKSGEKVLLIDADLRRPNVHKTLQMANDLTLVEYLTGQSELDEVIQKDDKSGLHTILARSVPNSALDLLSSEKMNKLVASLRQVYDLVIIDSAACLAVSDARILATLSDKTLYAVTWNKTPREVVASGVKQLSDMGYHDLAFVLTNVDVKRHARYGYGDTVYYYGRYKEYYAE